MPVVSPLLLGGSHFSEYWCENVPKHDELAKMIENDVNENGEAEQILWLMAWRCSTSIATSRCDDNIVQDV